ncbi:Glycerophosphoryl diester phosphodiesterase [Giardia duodenalis]|uniref:Glycerophosphoryl diester phosphodiesterase n=1 Tax=Giardia intestinalis TaxID=5741 RepID=V6TDB0_GIAIN|nr:Glycerophosphoryl diester phosphodiesterase [Giardia intestinalis]
MLQVISRKALSDASPKGKVLSTTPIGNCTVSQLALNAESLSSLKHLLLSLVQGSSPDKIKRFEEQLHTMMADVHLVPYISMFISDGALPVFRKAFNFTLYPMFHIELCHKTLENAWTGIENEYSLRLGPLEPLLSFRTRSTHLSSGASSTLGKIHLAGYIFLSKHALLTPLYFASTVSLELFANKPGTNVTRPIIAYRIPVSDFIAQTERTHTIPVDSTVEVRVTYCGQHAPDHLCNLPRSSLTLPTSPVANTLPILGHRGCGSNKIHFGQKAPILENTPLSILTARQMGCVGSELDIILTKDMVPVINHDFELNVIADTILQSKISLPIPCMLYHEIANLENPRGIKAVGHERNLFSSKHLSGRSTSVPLMRYHTKCTEILINHESKEAFHNALTEEVLKQNPDCGEEHRVSYPVITEQKRLYTLAEILEQCTDMILNIELKYPSRFSPYSTLYPSRLALVKVVLDTLNNKAQMNSSKAPRVFISSFDSIICILVKLLAPSIPVFLLFLGDNETVAPYMDVDLTVPSQLFSEDAISVASSINLTGVVLWKDILSVQTGPMCLYEYAHHHGLTVLTYGTAVGEAIQDQQDKGVSALICDLCHYQGLTVSESLNVERRTY